MADSAKLSKNPKWAMVIDLQKCIGCDSCTVACKAENRTPPGVRYNVLLETVRGTYPHVVKTQIPRPCMQCGNAPCVQVCPVKATYKLPSGITAIDYERCIGCRYCMMACPYGVRSYNEATRVVEKCTLCAQLQAVGEPPACVKICPAHCRFVGNIDDPNSEVAKVIKEAGNKNVHALPDVGNRPSARYILNSKIAKWRE